MGRNGSDLHSLSLPSPGATRVSFAAAPPPLQPPRRQHFCYPPANPPVAFSRPVPGPGASRAGGVSCPRRLAKSVSLSEAHCGRRERQHTIEERNEREEEDRP